LKFNRLHASVYDLDTNRLVGTGNYAKISLPAKSFPDILLPLNFTYVATNSSDQTCQFYLLSLLSNPLTLSIQTKTGTTAARTKVSSLMASGPVSVSSQMIIQRFIQFLAVKFRLVVEMDIQGLPSSHAASTQVTDANCPIELPLNAA